MNTDDISMKKTTHEFDSKYAKEELLIDCCRPIPAAFCFHLRIWAWFLEVTEHHNKSGIILPNSAP